MQCLEFGGGAIVGMAVAAFVVAVERLADRRRVGKAGDRDLDVVPLPGIAHLGMTFEDHGPRAEIANERGARLLLHLAEQFLQQCHGALVEQAGERL